MVNNPAFEVQAHQQSLWLDYIHRQELDDGTLQERIDAQGIRGVTSNPSIFRKAIGGSDVYDSAMSEMLDLDAQTVYEHLAVADIQAAADLFRPIYDESDGRDGFVSLEVSPLLANNTENTIEEAKRLAVEVDRPNLMIKIPATEAGIPAIEEVIAAGINVNVTLIFAVDNYKEVAAAYIRGLERRVDVGEDISQIASVASFFLSRIDSAIDNILENNIRVAQVHGDTSRIAANRRLLGQAAIANARLAYQTFQQIFTGTRFKHLRDAGAQVQRPLWASTSTKNAKYSDTRYIDNLIAPQTVNTVPPQTLEAFIEHGTVGEMLAKTDDEFRHPEAVLDKLMELNIDMERIAHRLQVDGVDAFAEDFETLLAQVHAKLNVLRTGVMGRQKMALGIYAEDFNRTMREMDKSLINERIWSRDGSVWKQHSPTIHAISKRLGWLDAHDTTDYARLHELQAAIKAEDIDHVVLVGMGGSSLAADVMFRIFGQQDDFPALIVLDSTDPVRIQQVEAEIDFAKTLFVVASKSGTTIETMTLYKYFYQQTSEDASRFIAITDPETPLAQTAEREGFRDLFLNPADVGGRYSALTYFGMVPAAVMGLDLDRLKDEAQRMIDACHEDVPAPYHPGINLGTYMGVLQQQGRDKATIYTTESLSAFGDWAEQLIAESLGKENKTLLPVVGETITRAHDYASDRQFIYLRVDDDPDIDAMDDKVRALREAGQPRATLRIKDTYSIAGEFFRWEYATAVAGCLMSLNPFDEPNVAEAKDATREQLAYYREHGHLPDMEPILTGEHTVVYSDETTIAPLREMCRAHGYDPNSRTEVLAAQFAGTHSGDYFTLLCYLTPTPEVYAMLHTIRNRIRLVTKRAVTIGFGPRYLHSTGQLHKGGGDNGIFFQITHELDESHDIAIPGEDYSFGTLFQAQARGDIAVLQGHDCRAYRLHIRGEAINGLQKLLDAIEFVQNRRW